MPESHRMTTAKGPDQVVLPLSLVQSILHNHLKVEGLRVSGFFGNRVFKYFKHGAFGALGL